MKISRTETSNKYPTLLYHIWRMFVDLEFNTAYSAIDRTAKVQFKKNTIIRQFKRYIAQMFAGFVGY